MRFVRTGILCAFASLLAASASASQDVAPAPAVKDAQPALPTVNETVEVSGGVPLLRDSTGGVRHLIDRNQGQRQTIGRTVISTVPTLLQREGIFTEAVGGRVPVIYDPATDAAARSPFPDNAIPAARMDPVAVALLQRYPRLSSAGTANNFRRTALETDDQDQADVRIDHQSRGNRHRLFGRLSYFNGDFTPVTPLPDGSGVTSGTLGPQSTTAWALASSYQRASGARWVNELRAGDTRRNVERTATRLDTEDRRVQGPAPRILPTFLIAGYQQLGSPPSTETDFGTGVTQVADTLTWLAGAHVLKAGFDFRWSRLNVVQPPSPAGLYQFSSLFTDLPGVANTGSPLASFLLGQVQTFSTDLQEQQIRNRARVQEYFVQDEWRASDWLTISPGVRYTLNFPSVEEHDQAAVFNLKTRQLEYLGRDGQSRSARRLHWGNLGPRLGIAARANDATVVSAGYGMVWIEQAGITTPFTTPVFPFLQTVSQRSIDSLTPAFVLAQGRA